MVKDRIWRKYICKELVVAVDRDAGALSRLRTRRVRNYELGRVGALPADQRTADAPCGRVKRHSLRQRRKAGVRAYGIGVRRRTPAGHYRAARIRFALRSTWARGGCYRQ